MTDQRPAPEQCPEPFWHKTHRYCPVCTWQEPEETMPQMVGEWRDDPDPIRRAIFWLIERSWADADDFEACQAAARAIWPLRTRR